MVVTQDLSADFYRAAPAGLISTLARNGITGKVVRWIISFLSGKTQSFGSEQIFQRFSI